MSKPKPPAQFVPNLWHLSALAWGTSILLFSLFASPLCINATGLRLQFCLLVAHFTGVLYLWRVGSKHGNPERLMDMAIITLIFIYLAPLCMLSTPVIVLSAYALPDAVWQLVSVLFACSALSLATLRIWNTAHDDETGRRFELCIINELHGNSLRTTTFSDILSRVGNRPTQPTKIDGWSMIAAVATGSPILDETIRHNTTSTVLGICALVTTPLAMHAVSRLAVHAYLWIYRLRRFERESGIRVTVEVRPRG